MQHFPIVIAMIASENVYRNLLLCACLRERITKEHDVGLEDAATSGTPATAQHMMHLLTCCRRPH